jgi:hypothetical protein
MCTEIVPLINISESAIVVSNSLNGIDYYSPLASRLLFCPRREAVLSLSSPHDYSMDITKEQVNEMIRNETNYG